MKRAVLTLALLLSAAASVFADEPEKVRSFSLELGVGAMPLHMYLVFPASAERELADLGQRSGDSKFDVPAISLSEVWRLNGHWEVALTEGVCWRYFDIIQYPEFGIDPDGKPRYDLHKGYSIGAKATPPVVSLTGQLRFIWSPKWKVTAYSAVQIGFTTASYIIPLPGITPVAVRYGGKHLYGFAEVTLGPVASFAHGGLGWRF